MSFAGITNNSTFHSVYISTLQIPAGCVYEMSLHSTLFILVQFSELIKTDEIGSLHSTLFILVLFVFE